MRLGVIAVAWALASCAHMDREHPDQEPQQVARVVVVICIFSSCHRTVQPERAPQAKPAGP